jgi:Cu(I)/Ag(I) efflux system membrane fusion protein
MLKPGMFVTARLEAEIDEKGRVIKPEWAGKYVCPVHPTEQVSSIPGVCQDSKLALKPASAYGYLDDPNPVFPLVIPAAAPLITGKRAIVYVEIPDADRPTYELREVVLGPRAGDRYVVYQGLKEGERVVTKGNFKIDSAMQILGKASMMKPDDPKYSAGTAQKPQDEELIEKIDVPHEFLKALSPAIDDYLALKDALVDEKLGDAAASAKRLLESLRKIHTGDLDTKAQDTWKQLLNSMESPLKRMDETKDVETLRKAFDPFSEAFVRMLMSFGHATSEPVVVFHCPMAFDSQGAYWVERGEERRNPYFGRKPYKGQDMLQCGELVEKIPPEVRPTPASAGSDRPAHGESDDQDRGSGSKSGNIDRGSGAKD